MYAAAVRITTERTAIARNHSVPIVEEGTKLATPCAGLTSKRKRASKHRVNEFYN